MIIKIKPTDQSCIKNVFFCVAAAFEFRINLPQIEINLKSQHSTQIFTN